MEMLQMGRAHTVVEIGHVLDKILRRQDDKGTLLQERRLLPGKLQVQ